MPDPRPQSAFLQLIEAEQTHSLRHGVLRPHQQLEDMVYTGDNHPDTFHFGAFQNAAETIGQPIGVVTMNLHPMPGNDQPGDWRLRGMAVAPDWQNQGIGSLLVQASIEEVTQRGGQRVWCNARVTAMNFYIKLGFVTHGEEFEIINIGPHYVMSIAVDSMPR